MQFFAFARSAPACAFAAPAISMLPAAASTSNIDFIPSPTRFDGGYQRTPSFSIAWNGTALTSAACLAGLEINVAEQRRGRSDNLEGSHALQRPAAAAGMTAVASCDGVIVSLFELRLILF